MISLSGKTKEKAVEDLLLQNYDQYYRLAYSYVHNEADAGDIVQNGAYKAIRSSSDLKEVRYAATWLYRIMLNEIFLSVSRKKQSRWKKETTSHTTKTLTRISI